MDISTHLRTNLLDFFSYFERDSDEDEGGKERNGRRERKKEKRKEENAEKEGEEEEDPLDAFMAGINEEANQAKKDSEQKEKDVSSKGEYSGGQAGRDDIDEEDMQGGGRRGGEQIFGQNL